MHTKAQLKLVSANNSNLIRQLSNLTTDCQLYNIMQDDPAQQKIFFTCEGKHYLIFEALLFIGEIILGLLNALVAFQTKKHLPADKKYRKYHESAVINLTTMMAIFLSSICEVIIILFQKNNYKDGILLLIILRECFWLYPIIFLLFIPKVRPCV